MPQTAWKLKPLRGRDIIEIDEARCDGCGLCVSGCAEGALEIIEGKARLVSESYCDGLGACLAECPRGALRIVRRESEGFDEEAALAAKAAREARAARKADGTDEAPSGPGGCPGARQRPLGRGDSGGVPAEEGGGGPGLANWPIQMTLVHPKAEFLEAPALALAADCTAFAVPGFHREFLGAGVPLVIGCPKLDDVDAYIIKIGEILKAHPSILEVRAAIMEVPCCRGLAYAAVRGVERSGRADVSLRLFVAGLDGTVREELPEGAVSPEEVL
ncbi:MAG: 4Fe-4S dicluster domain-containing protein [Deltaproteobacteria bacterium]|jgi:ferredoxin|nr:4Fe-4S dicluster domain-containing protein [Deltaproteobacteria bacterium]